jgi:signal transduction histidine kinase
VTAAPATSGLVRRALLLASCAALAVLWNLHPFILFFDIQLMLGTSLGVFALLVWGWPGLAVGIAALLVTFQQWGHPFGLINGTIGLIWLGLFLHRCNGGWQQRDNGRIVMASIAYWVLIGGWAEWVWFRWGMGISSTMASGLALKEVVNGVTCAALGLALFMLLRLWQARTGEVVVSIRGLCFGLVLVAVLTPALVLQHNDSSRYRLMALEQQLRMMQTLGDLAAASDGQARARLLERYPNAAIEIGSGASAYRSDPALFNLLDTTFAPETGSRLPIPGLSLLMRQDQWPILQNTLGGFWSTTLAGPPAVRIVAPARKLVEDLDAKQPTRSFLRLAGLLLLGALISDGIAAALEGQFRQIVHRNSASGPLIDDSDNLAMAGSPLREVDSLVRAIQERDTELRRSQTKLLQVLENLPIAVAGVQLNGSKDQDSQEELIFVNQQLQSTLGYQFEDLASGKQWMEQAFPVASYREEVNQRWNGALERARGEQGRVESLDLVVRAKGGSTHDVRVSVVVNESLLIVSLLDLTERRRAERQLASVMQREKQQEQHQRQDLERRLRSSLSAAAVVHEIKQPLSTILLNCQLAVQTLDQLERHGGSPADDARLGHTLRQLTINANRVVDTMERMRMLLRNVETNHQPVDLAATVDSSLLFLKTELRQQGTLLRVEGLDNPCGIQGDASQLQMAINNLIRNALEAMQSQGSSQAVGQLAVTLRQESDQAVLTIADSGPGFPPGASELPLTSTKPEGSGLGLFVVRTTLEHHNGQLKIGRSSELGGAEVQLLLPMGR